MTRKDYIKLADVLNSAYFAMATQPTQQAGVMYAVEQVAFACKRDNPRFDREHFLAVVRGEKPLHSRPSRKAGAR